MIVTARRIREGYKLPFFYGIAYEEVGMRMTIAYPIPFNFLVGWFRQAFYRLLTGPRLKYLMKLEQEVEVRLEQERSSGFRLGYKDGENRAWAQTKRLVALLSPEVAEQLNQMAREPEGLVHTKVGHGDFRS